MDLRSEFQMQCLQFVCVSSLAGQLDDLLYILDEAGMPSASNKYIFNGDFVDRGSKGVEIMSILLALFMAFPGKFELDASHFFLVEQIMISFFCVRHPSTDHSVYL